MCDYFSLIPKCFFLFVSLAFLRNLASIRTSFQIRQELLIVTFEETDISHWSVQVYWQPTASAVLSCLTFNVEFWLEWRRILNWSSSSLNLSVVNLSLSWHGYFNVVAYFTHVFISAYVQKNITDCQLLFIVVHPVSSSLYIYSHIYYTQWYPVKQIFLIHNCQMPFFFSYVSYRSLMSVGLFALII